MCSIILSIGPDGVFAGIMVSEPVSDTYTNNEEHDVAHQNRG